MCGGVETLLGVMLLLLLHSHVCLDNPTCPGGCSENHRSFRLEEASKII